MVEKVKWLILEQMSEDPKASKLLSVPVAIVLAAMYFVECLADAISGLRKEPWERV